MTRRRHLIRGTGRLVVDATTGLVDVVEAMHHNILRGPFFATSEHGRTHGRTRGLNALVYRTLRTLTRLAGTGFDALLEQAPDAHDTPASRQRDALVAALNGVVGDHLAATHNPLAIAMGFRSAGRPLELTPQALATTYPSATGKLLVLLHGSCMSDRQWLRHGHDHGQALARDLGYTPVYLHYNSGLHVATNGAAFAALLQQLAAVWPQPLEDLVLLCHSMGGLIARSTCDHAPTLPIRRMIFLGTPHHGSPFERGGNIITALLGVSPYTGPLSRLAKIRSAGITDLRHGTIDPPASDRFDLAPDSRRAVPLPPGIACYAIAASLTATPLTGPVGDGVVPVDSALGRHRDPSLALGIPADRCLVAVGLGHVDLLDHPDVYAQLTRWLAPRG